MLRCVGFLLMVGSLIACDDSATKTGNGGDSVADGSGGKSSANNTGSGGQSGGAGSGTTGGKAGAASTVVVPRTKKLGDLSEADLTSLCMSHQAEFDSLADPCTGVGFDASSEAACKEAEAACKKEPANQGSQIDCTNVDANDVKGCNATVGEFADCLTTLAAYFKQLTCANFQDPPQTPACFTTIQQECPSLFGP